MGTHVNGRTYFKHGTLFDGTGRQPFPGGLVVDGDKITQVGDIDPEPNGNGAQVIDLAGRTLIPGMILSHVHLSYNHIKDLPDLDLKQPAEVATIAAVCNARLMLD